MTGEQQPLGNVPLKLEEDVELQETADEAEAGEPTVGAASSPEEVKVKIRTV